MEYLQICFEHISETKHDHIQTDFASIHISHHLIFSIALACINKKNNISIKITFKSEPPEL